MLLLMYLKNKVINDKMICEKPVYGYDDEVAMQKKHRINIQSKSARVWYLPIKYNSLDTGQT